jgi:arylsulfatase A-like enzyme
MKLTRRHFFLGSLAPLAFGQKKRPEQQPNILLIIADGLPAWMLGAYGNRETHTPNLDRLAQTGTLFLNNFACAPCGPPSFATLLTGRTPAQHGIQDSLAGSTAPPPAFNREIMISSVLAAEEYNCGFVGQWNLGAADKPQHDFQFWYTVAGGPFSYQDPKIYRNGEMAQEKGYLGALITAQAADFVNRQSAAKPFFLAVAYPNPRPPYEGHPQTDYDLYSKASFGTFTWEPPGANATQYKELLGDVVSSLRKAAAAITALDDQIPGLLSPLRQRGLYDNTLIIFCSTHGWLLGRHGLWGDGQSSDPVNMYEEVVQAPLFWSWPGRVPAQATRPEVVSLYDLMPTLCDLAGVDAPERNLCGRSYLPLATGKPLPKKQPWRNVVYGHYRNADMIRDKQYKLVLRDDGKGPNDLFALTADPHEKVNQYDNPQFIASRAPLEAALAKWKQKYSA